MVMYWTEEKQIQYDNMEVFPGTAKESIFLCQESNVSINSNGNTCQIQYTGYGRRSHAWSPREAQCQRCSLQSQVVSDVPKNIVGQKFWLPWNFIPAVAAMDKSVTVVVRLLAGVLHYCQVHFSVIKMKAENLPITS